MELNLLQSGLPVILVKSYPNQFQLVDSVEEAVRQIIHNQVEGLGVSLSKESRS